MPKYAPHHSKHLILFVLICLFFILDIYLGSVHIPIKTVFNTLFGNCPPSDEKWRCFIVLNYRLPRAITSVLVGSGLSVSGLLMQALFRNPLAGPFTLGISSGAGLGVAALHMSAGLLGFSLGLSSTVVASSMGCFLILSIILIVTQKIKDIASVLIIGVMFSSFSGAIINILSYFSASENLKKFIFWSMGSMGNLSFYEISILLVSTTIGIIGAFVISKGLNGLLLGENYAKSIGVNFPKLRLAIIFISTLLAGVITAFSGPIAFIGLAVPHVVRQFYKTLNHRTLIIATTLTGALALLICDIIAQVPFQDFGLPINAVTSLFGAPLVIWILLKRKNLIF